MMSIYCVVAEVTILSKSGIHELSNRRFIRCRGVIIMCYTWPGHRFNAMSLHLVEAIDVFTFGISTELEW